MKNRIRTVVVLAVCIFSVYGCVPLQVRDAKISMESDAVIGTYNFAKATARCSSFCLDDCGPDPKPSYDSWEWIKVPDGATPPEIVVLDKGYVAFVPQEAGNYQLSVEITCEEKGYKEEVVDTASGSIEAEFLVGKEELLIKSSKILTDEEGAAFEEGKKLVKNIFPSAVTWFESDYNDDGANEMLIYSSGSWIVTSADNMQKLFNLTEKTASNTKVLSALNVRNLEDGKKEIFVSALNSSGIVIMRYKLDFANKTIERISVSTPVDGIPIRLSADLNDNEAVNFLVDKSIGLSCVMSIYSIADNETNPTMIGKANICDKAESNGFFDEEMAYKFGGKYFIYEETK